VVAGEAWSGRFSDATWRAYARETQQIIDEALAKIADLHKCGTDDKKAGNDPGLMYLPSKSESVRLFAVRAGLLVACRLCIPSDGAGGIGNAHAQAQGGDGGEDQVFHWISPICCRARCPASVKAKMVLSTEDNQVSGHWIYALAHEMQGMRSSLKECGKVRAVDARTDRRH
jgi:hypothetical protein